MTPARLLDSFYRRDGLRYRGHTSLWRAHAWRCVAEWFAVVDDFGDLVVVEWVS